MSWQKELKARIDTPKKLKAQFSNVHSNEIDVACRVFKMAIPQYYANLIDETDETCPIRLQAIPSQNETNVHESEFEDPLGEEEDSPVNGITHRYPDRALFLITNQCFMYCRHCNRRRKVGDEESNLSNSDLENALLYLKENASINDVLISGGDPLFCSDDKIEWILCNLREIKHIKTVRIGTRAPVVFPMRITQKLVSILQKFHPLWVNTHFNHPKEITRESKEALNLLANAGIPLGNQTVLLKGVNDCPHIVKELCLKLVENRVRPYYLFQCDLAKGISHFRTPIARGIEIMESLIGHIRGYAVPTFAIDLPGGVGKVPLAPNYMLSMGTDAVVVRNYEGLIAKYFEPEEKASTCPSTCKETEEKDVRIGLHGLLEKDGPLQIEPQNSHRMLRRKKYNL